MSFLFGEKKKDPKELLRENQKELRKSEREMEREAMHMKREEQKLIADIKKASKDGNMVVAKTLAKQLIRVREQTARTTMMKAQVKGVASSMSLAVSQNAMTESMGKVGQAMGAMNKQVDPLAMAKILNEFAQENEKMDAKQELMDEALDGIFDDDAIEEEADAVTQQVLDEIGLDQFGRMAAPKGKASLGAKVEEAEEEGADDALAARLAALRH